MFFLKTIINYFDDIYLFKCDIIIVIEIGFLNYIKMMIFKNFDIIIQIILY